MTEVTATQTARAMIEKIGATELAIAFARAYWPAVVGFVTAIVYATILVIDVKDIKASQAAQQKRNERVDDQIAQIGKEVGEMHGSLTTLFDAAKITVTTTKQPAPKPKR
jgi:hypothetical protein